MNECDEHHVILDRNEVEALQRDTLYYIRWIASCIRKGDPESLHKAEMLLGARVERSALLRELGGEVYSARVQEAMVRNMEHEWARRSQHGDN